MILVDTSVWYELFDKDSQKHETISDWYRRNQEPLLTTDLIIVETVTLLRARGRNDKSLLAGQALFAGALAAIYFLSPEEYREVWGVFQRYSDKDW